MKKFEGEMFKYADYNTHCRVLSITVNEKLIHFETTVMINTWTTTTVKDWHTKLIGDDTGWKIEVYNNDQQILLCGDVYMEN